MGMAFEDLMARTLERVETEGAPALEEICAAHPEHAAALRARVAALGSAGMLRVADGNEALPERLGEFRLLTRIGGGGMGVVYLAEQEGLGRRVALKLIKPELLFFPGARERFRREVEAASRLQHPGIVPVYAVGEDRGLPYLAMEHVPGCSLDRVVEHWSGRRPERMSGADLRDAVRALCGTSRGRGDTTETGDASRRLFAGSWTEACLRVARALAEALHHAHERGVLHRDMKPSNAMITGDGRVLLLDFGIAAAEGSARLTSTGSQLGSVAYMPPEQLRGEVVDARADVYALGVTLFELLALRHPFAADHIEETRGRILDGATAPLRVLNPTVPRDAEVVCLMAMERDAGRRYASAAALAEDLTRVLERRPILGRPPGALLRVRRWTQRHPAATVACILGPLLVIGAPLVYALQQRAANIAIREALEKEQRARDVAEANFRRARSAVDTLLTEVGYNELDDVPEMEPVRRRLLEQALAFYSEFLAERGADPLVREETARAAWRVGDLLAQLGRTQEAVAAQERAVSLAEALLEEAPLDPQRLDLLGDVLRGHGAAQGALGRIQQALADAERSLEVRRRRLELQPADVEAHGDLYEALGLRASLLSRTRPTEAMPPLLQEVVDQADVRLEHARGKPNDVPPAIVSAIVARGNLANAWTAIGEAERSLAVLEEARELCAILERNGATWRDARTPVLATHRQLADALRNVGRVAEAEEHFRIATEGLRELEQRFPQLVDVRRQLATTLNNLGVMLLDMPGRKDDARAALEQSARHLRRLLQDAPDTPEHWTNLSATLINIAAAHRDDGEHDAARELLLEAEELSTRALAQTGAETWRRNLHQARWYLCLTERDRGEFQVAARYAASMPDLLPGDPVAVRRAAGLIAEIAPLAAAAAGADASASAAAARPYVEQAFALLDRAVAAGYRDRENLLSAPDVDPLRKDARFAAILQRMAAPDVPR